MSISYSRCPDILLLHIFILNNLVTVTKENISDSFDNQFPAIYWKKPTDYLNYVKSLLKSQIEFHRLVVNLLFIPFFVSAAGTCFLLDWLFNPKSQRQLQYQPSPLLRFKVSCVIVINYNLSMQESAKGLVSALSGL